MGVRLADGTESEEPPPPPSPCVQGEGEKGAVASIFNPRPMTAAAADRLIALACSGGANSGLTGNTLRPDASTPRNAIGNSSPFSRLTSTVAPAGTFLSNSAANVRTRWARADHVSTSADSPEPLAPR